MPYKTPTTISQYWNTIFEHWNNINHILNVFLPTFNSQWIDGSKLDKTLGEYIIELKDTKNPRIVRAFNAALWNMPIETGEWDYPGFEVLKDLCYNEQFLYEEKEEE